MASEKVYLRNFGKGILEFSDNSLKFFVEKGGLFSKKRELAKEFCFADIKEFTLDNCELNFEWEGLTQRFVFEDKGTAEKIYSSIDQSSKKIGEPTSHVSVGSPNIGESESQDQGEVVVGEVSVESKSVETEAVPIGEASLEPKTEGQAIVKEVSIEPKVSSAEDYPVQEEKVLPTKEEYEANSHESKTQIDIQAENKKESVIAPSYQPPAPIHADVLGFNLNAALETVDSLFDILRSLHGRVDWVRTSKCLTLSEQAEKSLVESGAKIAPLDFALLSSAVSLHNIQQISAEDYRQLDLLFQSFQNLDAPEESSPSTKFCAKAVIQSYYLLNDIILSFTVGDENVADEINRLSAILANLAVSSGYGLKTDEMVVSAGKCGVELENESLIRETRSLFKGQLNLAVTS